MARLMAALAATAVTALVGSAVAQAQAPPGDSVTGAGSINHVDNPCAPSPECGPSFGTFNFDARSGPSGENPTGTVSGHIGGGAGATWSGEVTCLSVTGNTALIGFTGLSVGPVAYHFAGLIRAVDVGSAAGAPFDTFESAERHGEVAIGSGEPPGEPLPGPTDCSSYPSTFPILQAAVIVVGGDIVITDTRPVPVSTSQCKDGGWHRFGFKSPGQCVVFVAKARVCSLLARFGYRPPFCPPSIPVR